MGGGLLLLPLYPIMAVADYSNLTRQKTSLKGRSLFYNCDTMQLNVELLALQPTALQFYIILF